MSYCLNPHCPQPKNPPDRLNFCLACGEKLLLKERYRALHPLGEGAFGRTYLAVDEHRLQMSCVIKQFLPQVQGSSALEKAMELFQHEADRLQDLGTHAQIPALLAYFEQGNQLFLVEEWIDGKNLLQELQEQGVFSEEKIQKCLIDLLPVLQFIHEHQVIHRDIKPENIVRRRQGSQLVLLDFGVAKQNSLVSQGKTGTRTGTAGYAPIEQIRGGKAYPASDLYSLGVTCIHLLTGVRPDDLFDPIEGEWQWRSHLMKQGRTIHSGLGKILDKLLKDLVRERYQSAAEVLQDLTNNQQNAKPKGVVTSSPSSQNTSNPPVVTPVKTSLSTASSANTIQSELAAVAAEMNQGMPNPISLPQEAATPQLGELEELKNKPRSLSQIEAELQSVKAEYQTSQAHFQVPSQHHTWQQVQSLTGHLAPVNAIVITPQGNIVVSGSDDKTVKLWNLETGQLIHSFSGGHSAPVDTVAIAPNGRILLTGGLDRKIIEWQLDSRTLIREFYSHYGSPQSHRYGAVHSIALSPNGEIVASGSADKSIKLWYLYNGELIHKISGHSDKVWCVSFSPVGNAIVSGSTDRTLKLWRLWDWKNLQTFAGHTGGVHAVAFSPNGQILASGSADATVKLWNVETGSLLQTLRGHAEAVLSVAIDVDGLTVASGSGDGTVKLWSLKTGELLEDLSGRNPVTFSPDGRSLVCGGSDRHQLLIWRMRN